MSDITCKDMFTFSIVLAGMWGNLGVVQAGGLRPEVFRLYLQLPGAGKKMELVLSHAC